MAGGFDNGVATPGGASYMAPLLNFSQIGDWAKDYAQGGLNEQQKAMNSQRIAEAQRQADLAKTFEGGLPRDKDGNIDYKTAVSMLAQKGDINALWNGADAMLSQSATLSPMLSGGGQPAGQPQQPQGGQPTSVPAKPLPPMSGNSPQGDAGSGTVASLVTDRLPNQDAATGQTIGRIAGLLGVDPNATLTPGQLRRAQGLLQKYAPTAGTPTEAKLPPSAIAVSPAPKVAPPPAPSAQPGQGGQPAPGAPAPAAPQGQPQPQQPPGGPITPQVQLPPGFTDPQKAIAALRAEAARLSVNPKAAGQVKQLDAWREAIEASIKPLSVNPNTTMIDPATGKQLYQGPGAAMMSGMAGGSESRDADAEVYRQTGKLPPRMGAGMQGSAEARAIRAQAVQQEIAEGGDPADWPSRWQNFSTQATGKRVLEQRAAGLSLAENEASSLIPRVREISAKVSRTNYPTLNALILASQKGSGGQDVIKLGIAIESLVPVYARVLKPVGQVGQGDMARAHDILDKAWSDGQIGAALDQMQIELTSARTALDKTMKESENRGRGKKETAAKPDADGWVTTTNGSRVQEIK